MNLVRIFVLLIALLGASVWVFPAWSQVRIESRFKGCQEDDMVELRAVTSGKGPFTYTWSTGHTSERISVNGGTFSVEVRNAQGSVGKTEIRIQPADFLPRISGTVTPGADTRISATVTGGVAPYTYQWTRVGDKKTVLPTTSSVSVSQPGVYRLVATDARGCVAMRSFTVKRNR